MSWLLSWPSCYSKSKKASDCLIQLYVLVNAMERNGGNWISTDWKMSRSLYGEEVKSHGLMDSKVRVMACFPFTGSLGTRKNKFHKPIICKAQVFFFSHLFKLLLGTPTSTAAICSEKCAEM
uniref:Uncharacterized protein n=1 Tax=Nelumbo nucifera TaxID=4432 RepID=A0A822YYU0_NELNU|nr:TPA_asm: hypothetical protein HUJ06_008483 [Nelumbo nucifera]